MHQQRPRLEGKVAIVTDAGSSGPGVGTGKAASVLFAREGAKVILVDRVAKHADGTLSTIREEGGEASIFEADVTSDNDCRGMVEAAEERYGAIHILFNNVGIRGSGSVVDVKEEEWDRVLDVNLKSMVLASKYAIPGMIRSGGGSIINASSIVGIRGRHRTQHSLRRFQGRCNRPDHVDGCPPRTREYPGELHSPPATSTPPWSPGT